MLLSLNRCGLKDRICAGNLNNCAVITSTINGLSLRPVENCLVLRSYNSRTLAIQNCRLITDTTMRLHFSTRDGFLRAVIAKRLLVAICRITFKSTLRIYREYNRRTRRKERALIKFDGERTNLIAAFGIVNDHDPIFIIDLT